MVNPILNPSEYKGLSIYKLKRYVTVFNFSHSHMLWAFLTFDRFSGHAEQYCL